MMKFTGIVRRLDGLGRIVIPREYRKMHKIKESDPLEIIALENGDIVIRKFDSKQTLIDASSSIVQEILKNTSLGVMVSDSEDFLVGAGNIRSILIDKKISKPAKEVIEQRKSKTGLCAELGLDCEDYVIIEPIFASDCFGAIYLFSKSPISIEETKLIRIISNILADILQKY